MFLDLSDLSNFLSKCFCSAPTPPTPSDPEPHPHAPTHPHTHSASQDMSADHIQLLLFPELCFTNMLIVCSVTWLWMLRSELTWLFGCSEWISFIFLLSVLNYFGDLSDTSVILLRQRRMMSCRHGHWREYCYYCCWLFWRWLCESDRTLKSSYSLTNCCLFVTLDVGPVLINRDSGLLCLSG